MNRKNFKNTFDDILKTSSVKNDVIKSEKNRQVKKETKATFIILSDQLDKLRAISYMERKMIKNVLRDALSLYIDKYEKENSSVPLPKK